MTEQEMTELAAKVAKSLRWAAFLTAAVLVILLIDLQLKRSIGRQAVAASALISRGTHRLVDDFIKGGPDEQGATVAAPGGLGSNPGGSGRDDVGRDAPVATGDDDPDGTGKAAENGLPAGPRKRAPRNGPRASGSTGG